MGSLSQFEENVGPLRRGHLSAGEGIRGIGFFEGVKNADYFLHSFILLWFRLDFPFWFRYLSIPAPQFTPAAFSPRARCMRSSQCENASAAVWRNWESPLETSRRLGTRLGFFQKPGGPANLPPALDPLSLSVGARALGRLSARGLVSLVYAIKTPGADTDESSPSTIARSDLAEDCVTRPSESPARPLAAI